jgi:hypothetical protein
MLLGMAMQIENVEGTEGMAQRYLVFAGQHYYPNHGWYDFRGSTQTLEDAQALVELCRQYDQGWLDWWQIVDLETERIVAKGQFKDDGGSYGDVRDEEAELGDWWLFRQAHTSSQP